MDTIKNSWIPWKVIDNSHKGRPFPSSCGCGKDTTGHTSQERPKSCNVPLGGCPWDYSGYE